jgi:hypothetical protein
MDKQLIAEKFEKSVLDRIHGLLVLLPNYISTENEGMFVTVCERVSKITTDAFTEAEDLGRQLLLTPWLIGSYGAYECAYGEGFTWKQFFDYVLESNCNSVEVWRDQEVPKIIFYDKDNQPQFIIELSRED